MLGLTSIDLAKLKTDILAIAVCEDENIHVDPIIEAVIRRALKLKEFNGEKDDTVTLYDVPNIKARRVILWGLGKLEKIDREALRSMAGKTVKYCINKKLTSLCFAVPDPTLTKMKMPVVLEAMQEGAYLGNHLFHKFKVEAKKRSLKQIQFWVKKPISSKMRRLTTRVTAICQGTIMARDWVSTPSNEKTPEKFTRSIVSLASKQRLKVQVLNQPQLKQKKLGALLAVAAGSQSKPSMVILEHKVQGAKKTIALLGKGVTFDSGGLNLKTGASISDMKSDMSGAAAVAATLIAAAKLKTKANIIGAIPIVENMPSGKATRPGDIIRSYAGKTIEIGNTDAEGRLILCDALTYTERFEPAAVIDIATLTGACIVALGDQASGLMANDDKLWQPPGDGVILEGTGRAESVTPATVVAAFESLTSG